MSFALGLMSGTSADGVSLVLCSFQKRNFKILNYLTSPYPPALSQQLIEGIHLKTPQISRLNILLGNFFADSILKFLKSSKVAAKNIAVIGSHGHTIYHGGSDKPKNTLQIGEPCVIAEKTGIPVIADFRMRDLACGGEGAPLIPFFDQTFFGGGKRRALQNIGGIANVTIVGKSSPLLAFDNGPGNCLIDWAVRKISRGRRHFDQGGRIAARGRVNRKAVLRMAKYPYFKKIPPKSAGREIFNEDFVPPLLKKALPEDLVATLTYFTAYSIDQSYRSFVRQSISEIIVSGGGAFNQTLMNHLKTLFAPVPVRSIEEYGIPAQAKEPAAFAFFAWEALHGRINHSPQGTGARKAAILGKFVPGKSEIEGSVKMLPLPSRVNA